MRVEVTQVLCPVVVVHFSPPCNVQPKTQPRCKPSPQLEPCLCVIGVRLAVMHIQAHFTAIFSGYHIRMNSLITASFRQVSSRRRDPHLEIHDSHLEARWDWKSISR